jgi:hypothetical protein
MTVYTLRQIAAIGDQFSPVFFVLLNYIVMASSAVHSFEIIRVFDLRYVRMTIYTLEPFMNRMFKQGVKR